MIIAIPTDDNTDRTNVCISFGRAPFFMLYDSETSNVRFIDNDAASSQGGAGIKAAQSLVDSKAGALLTPRCGDNAAEVLKAAGVGLYKTAGRLRGGQHPGVSGGRTAAFDRLASRLSQPRGSLR
jgi:predicted Fe-Mo cluster-binding NifX family protein